MIGNEFIWVYTIGGPYNAGKLVWAFIIVKNKTDFDFIFRGNFWNID